MRPLCFFLLVCPLFLTFAGCRNSSSIKTGPAQTRPASDKARYNDAAQFLAGLPGGPDSTFRALEPQPAWQNYSRGFAQLWGQVEQTQLQPVAQFQHHELNGPDPGDFVFYPFSGPDVLYATAFFPAAKHFVMAGLEPVGSVRAAETYTPESLPQDLNAWNNALYSIFKRSFFVTGEMTRQFHGRVADGILPTMLLLLARTGHAVDDIHYVHLDEQGRLVEESDSPFVVSQTPHRGVQIVFHRKQDTQRRTVEYFSTDLGPGFLTNPALARYLESQGRPDTFVKSASFLLHWHMCDPLREFILKQTNLLVQDDTGVPYGYLKPVAWDVHLYGQYSRPDRPFQKHYQKDLAGRFSSVPGVKPLGFSLGYGYGRRPSSLIIARRKTG